MKTEKTSIGLYAAGLFTIFIYTWKFFIKSDFTSMWIIGCGVGLGMIFITYMYSWMKDTDNQIDKLNKRLDAFSSWFIENKELK